MKLALSGRLWETPQGPSLTLLEQIQATAELGYEGYEVRYALLPQKNELEAVRDALQRHNVEVAFIPGGGVPDTPEKKADFIRLLDTTRFLGGKFVKQVPKGENDHDAMRLAADLGAERGIKVLTQYHSNTLTDTVEKTEHFFQTLNHPNLGLIWDSCHIPFSEELPLDEAMTRLQPWIDLVNLQSYKPAKADDGLQHITINGRDWSIALPGDPAGTDLVRTLEILKQQDYNGWLAVMPAVDPIHDPLDVARTYREFITPRLA